MVYFEAQIQNITSSILFMEYVHLKPLKETTHIEDVTKLVKENPKNKKKRKDGLGVIKPLEVKQYLFKIIYDNIESEPKPLVAGKLDIGWRYSLGEIGHLQTHPLTQTV